MMKLMLWHDFLFIVAWSMLVSVVATLKRRFSKTLPQNENKSNKLNNYIIGMKFIFVEFIDV